MTSTGLVWANLRRQPVRAVLVLAAVSVAFMLYGLALGITEGFRLASMEQGLALQPGSLAVAIGVTAIGQLTILALTTSATAHAIRGRAPELALLLAIGFSHARILSLLVAETAAPCLAGAALGLVGAKLLFAVLVAAVPALAVVPAPVYSTTLVASAMTLALLVAVASAVIPGRRLARSPVIALMRGASIAVERPSAKASAPAAATRPRVVSSSPSTAAHRGSPVDLRLLNQIAVTTRVGLSTLRLRLRGIVLVFGSVAAIVFLLLIPFTALESIRVAITSSGDPARVILRSRTGVLLDQSRTPDGLAERLASAPGVAMSSIGEPLIDAEIFGWPRGLTIRDSGKGGHSPLVGVGPRWKEMTPSFRLLSGRLPRPSSHEILAGTLAAQKFGNLDAGTVTFGGEPWRVVGIFTTGDWWDGYLVGNAAELRIVAPPTAGSAVRVRLSSPEVFEDFRSAIAPLLPPALVVERETDFYASLWRRVPKHLVYIALVLATLISAGAALGTTLVMESALEDRRRELATLRLLGFDARALAAALLLEGLVLALCAALVSLALAWLVLDGRIMNGAWGVFRVEVDRWLLLFAIGWGAGIAVAGTSVLALRILRTTVLDAIQDLWAVCLRACSWGRLSSIH